MNTNQPAPQRRPHRGRRRPPSPPATAIPTTYSNPGDVSTDFSPAPLVALYTPAEAAALLRVRESWLRRKAGERTIPCTFVGKHLRFSATDLRTIVTTPARTQNTRRTRPRRV